MAALGRESSGPLDVKTVAHLAVYFEVGYRALLARLVSLREQFSWNVYFLNVA